MSVNSYLEKIANAGVVRGIEKDKIQTSLENLEYKAFFHFNDSLHDFIVFGSYKRGTMLPRKMDKNSDVDCMLVFPDDSIRQQSYLDRLKKFVEGSYSRSEIKQSHPTIVLELGHIKFELVPAIKVWGGYNIPDRNSILFEWQTVNPEGFAEDISEINKNSQYQLKPLIRVMKYWNAMRGYPFKSYKLEKQVMNIVDNECDYLFNDCETLEDYFYCVVDELSISMFSSERIKKEVERLRNIVKYIKGFKKRGDEYTAEKFIAKRIPISTLV